MYPFISVKKTYIEFAYVSGISAHCGISILLAIFVNTYIAIAYLAFVAIYKLFLFTVISLICKTGKCFLISFIDSI